MREWLPTPIFLPGETHGQRSLAGYSPWGLLRVIQDWTTTRSLSGWAGQVLGRCVNSLCEFGVVLISFVFFRDPSVYPIPLGLLCITPIVWTAVTNTIYWRLINIEIYFSSSGAREVQNQSTFRFSGENLLSGSLMAIFLLHLYLEEGAGELSRVSLQGH